MKTIPTRQVNARGIVDDRTFILATRESGYRDVATAVAELIDNSLQASATSIQVFVREGPLERDAHSESSERPVTIAVLDNGSGMGRKTLETALRFGGTNRFDDRTGFGRFGMGLPNSSVSQTRRFDVYSWQHGETPFFSYLDIDEVSSGRLQDIPPALRRRLPDWLQIHAMANGTAVLWSRCDRLGRTRATTVVQRLVGALGRMFRYAIWSGADVRVNGERLDAIDPLFLRGRHQPLSATAYGKRLCYEFSAPDSGEASTVDVQFSELPIIELHQRSTAEKRRVGVVGAAGVSIVRAGREIDYGWHLMGGKRRENYDDWWRCEIRFSPALDELFGVTHSKQGINPTMALRNTLGPDLEAIARTLNSRARGTFEMLKAAAPTRATKLVSNTDQFLGESHSPLADRVGGLRYKIEVSPLASPAIYAVSLRTGVLTLTLNEDHPFYKRIYAPACAPARDRERFAVECLLLAAARADAAMAKGRDVEAVTRLRTSWSDTLAAILDKS